MPSEPSSYLKCVGQVLVELLHVRFKGLEEAFVRLGVVDGRLDAGAVLLTLNHRQTENLFALAHQLKTKLKTGSVLLK